MEWGGDFVATPQGGLLLAYGPDQTRQGIIRELLTTSALTLDNGVTVQAEFILFPTLGGGLRILIGQNSTPDLLKQIQQKITNIVLKNPGVNPSVLPVIQTQQTLQPSAVYFIVSYTLVSGVPQTIAFEVA